MPPKAENDFPPPVRSASHFVDQDGRLHLGQRLIGHNAQGREVVIGIDRATGQAFLISPPSPTSPPKAS